MTIDPAVSAFLPINLLMQVSAHHQNNGLIISIFVAINIFNEILMFLFCFTVCRYGIQEYC